MIRCWGNKRFVGGNVALLDRFYYRFLIGLFGIEGRCCTRYLNVRKAERRYCVSVRIVVLPSGMGIAGWRRLLSVQMSGGRQNRSRRPARHSFDILECFQTRFQTPGRIRGRLVEGLATTCIRTMRVGSTCLQPLHCPRGLQHGCASWAL